MAKSPGPAPADQPPADNSETVLPPEPMATDEARDETVVPEHLAGEARTPAPQSAPEQTRGKVAAVPKNIRQAGITQLGDFKILKKLGAGAMGEVYKAQQVNLDREVALKVLAKARSKDKTFVERFLREARVMARLDHVNVIRFFGVGEQDGWNFLAMEFVDGGSVDDWYKKLRRFSVGDALRIIIDSARGLEHAHALKMVHRDIKPGNVLLTKKGVVKVADLGLAKATDSDMSLTTSGVGAGTPYYMSPEQTRNAKYADGRSDIYALGCMLYQFLVGAPPFKGNTPLEMVTAKEKGVFAPARRANPEVPERLDLILGKMLARDPKSRYQTCTELIADLEGLELASAALSFIEGAVPAPASKPAAGPGATRAPVSKAQATMTAPAPAEEKKKDVWFVRYRSEGKQLKRRMTTEQLKELIKDPDFDLEAEASRDPNEGYRRLTAYREFTSLLQGRLMKAQADKKVAKVRDKFGELEELDRQQRRWRWLKKMTGSVMGWVMLIVWLVAIAVGGVILFVGGRIVLTKLGF
jgi:tRNA A-37 threonylcarbamoyl transferase component Bud32